LYRQTLDLPYINKKDSRMIPITHEAYLAGSGRSGPGFFVGHIREIKKTDAQIFVPMSVAAGAIGTDKGVTVAGFKRVLGEDTNIGAFNNYGWDTFNTAYVEGGWVDPLAQLLGVTVSAQFTDQRSVGDELAGNFNTNSFGLSLAGDYQGMLLALAYTKNSDGGAILSPWGGSSLYNSMMLEDFNRAGENSLRLGFSWTGRGDRNSWSGFVNIVTGWNAIVADTGASLSNVNEYDVTVDYKPLSGKLSGLWLRLRGAYADFDDGTDRWNVRLILNRPFNFL